MEMKSYKILFSMLLTKPLLCQRVQTVQTYVDRFPFDHKLD